MTKEAADWVREHNDLKLMDFTRNGYKTILVKGDEDAIQELMDKHGYTCRGGPGGETGIVLDRKN